MSRRRGHTARENRAPREVRRITQVRRERADRHLDRLAEREDRRPDLHSPTAVAGAVVDGLVDVAHERVGGDCVTCGVAWPCPYTDQEPAR